MASSHIALVGNGNQGIGYAIVNALASKQAHLLLGNRDLDKGQEAAEKINKELNQKESKLLKQFNKDSNMSTFWSTML